MKPGEWVRDYAKLWSGGIGDAGEFLLGATPATDRVPTYSVQLRPGEAETVRFAVPQAAFPADADTVELATDGSCRYSICATWSRAASATAGSSGRSPRASRSP
jgi:hypothetical protein